jgi:hypothetical protein
MNVVSMQTSLSVGFDTKASSCVSPFRQPMIVATRIAPVGRLAVSVRNADIHCI